MSPGSGGSPHVGAWHLVRSEAHTHTPGVVPRQRTKGILFISKGHAGQNKTALPKETPIKPPEGG